MTIQNNVMIRTDGNGCAVFSMDSAGYNWTTIEGHQVGGGSAANEAKCQKRCFST